MSRFSGRQHKGAARELREQRRLEDEVRNAMTKPGRRSTKYLTNHSEEKAA